jgi:hypothetical protein
MKRSDAFPSRFLKAADLNGQDLEVIISGLEWEEIGRDKKRRPVLHFRGKVKRLPLNATNFDSIVRVTGEEDSDNWEGHKITLYRTQVQSGRELVDAIRVREAKSAKNAEKVTSQPLRDGDLPFLRDGDLPF